MIYTNDSECEIIFYRNLRTGESPVTDYIKDLNEKEGAKVSKYINFLQENKGYLDEPYSRHIEGKIRELRVDFGRSHHRIFYFTFIGKKIILLHAFLKNTVKTPRVEITKAEARYQDVISHARDYA